MDHSNGNNKRNDEIDYLRAYSVILVASLHFYLIACSQVLRQAPLFRDKFSLEAGVDIFFVISGYVVSAAYYRLVSSGLSAGELYLRFIEKRLIRLWPASTFWLFVCLWIAIALRGLDLTTEPLEAARGMLAGMFYIYNFEQFDNRTITGYFWSLSVEWQFYLFLPFLLAMNSRIRHVIILILFVALMFWRPGGENWWMFRFDGLLLGVFLHDVKDSHTIHRIREKVCAMCQGSKIISIAITVFLILEVVASPKYISLRYLGTSMSCMFAFFLVAISTFGRGIIFSPLPNLITLWLGLRSYSIYLSHIPVALIVLGFAEKLNQVIDVPKFVIFSVIGTLIASELSYRLLEKAKRSPVQSSLRAL